MEELAAFTAFMQTLDAKRRAEAEARVARVMAQGQGADVPKVEGWECYDMPSAAVVVPIEPPPAAPEIIDVVADELGDEVLIAAADVSEKDAVTALEAFLKHGGTVPKAVDLLKSFGVKRVGELASDKRGAFVAALQSTGSIENS